MKLSTKIFCTAYVIVLLSVGIGGALLIHSVNSALVSARREGVQTSVSCAADSFCEYADVACGYIAPELTDDIIRRIKESSEGVITDIEIVSPEDHPSIPVNTTVSHLIKAPRSLTLESVSKLETASGDFCLIATSDMTDIQSRCNDFWKSFTVTVIVVSAISGALLYFFALKMTYPLKALSKLTSSIENGSYGKKIKLKTSDEEIQELIISLNSMSSAIEHKIAEIRQEVEKRNTFVADFTHELKTPMTAIMGYSRMLSSYQLDEGERAEALNMIYNEAKRLEKLSLQLLDLYVFQNEKAEIEKINIKDVEEQLTSVCRHLAEKHNVHLEVDMGDSTVMANKVLLISLLYNLIDNAFKASFPNSVVEVYTERTKGSLRIFVKDRGRGIAKENLKLLTEPFFREDKSRSRKYGGAGLGLSLCKAIAELHGTSLNFESEKDKGTTVSFALKRGW